MNRAAKRAVIVVVALLVLVLSALLIIPMFMDVQQYKPLIEKRVSEATGRPFTLGGDLRLSLFPWAGLSFSDLHLGSPPDFEEKDLLAVEHFELRVKLLPLLFRDIQVKRFILEGPRVVLERNSHGRGNWEGIGKPTGEVSPNASDEKEAHESESWQGLTIKAIAVGEFAIKDASVLWIDRVKGERKEISNVDLRLEDVSLDRPIHLSLSAQLVGQPLSLEGEVGPLGKELVKGTIPFVLVVKAMNELDLSLKGRVVDPVGRGEFDFAIEVSPFSPKSLVAALGQTFPVPAADLDALDRMALRARLKGDPSNISVSDGVLDLDESKINFSVQAKDFSKPDVTFDLQVDRIDLDRYMPQPKEQQPAEEDKKGEAGTLKRKHADYTPLRQLVLNGTVQAGKLTVHGARAEDLNLKVAAKNGRFRLDPITLKLYEGNVSAKGTLDVGADIPRGDLQVDAKGVRVGPLLQDALKKDFLEGTARAKMALNMTGDDAEKIKSTLNGKGDLRFQAGAIKGIDLAAMVQNVKAAFDLAEIPRERLRTDFTEFHAPFTITNGVVSTEKTTLTSPLIQVLATGKADLVKERLDFRVEPEFVGALKGEGDTEKRAGLTVPVLVTGDFSSPKFRPDFEAILKKGIPTPSELKEILKGESTQEGESKPLEEKAKGLLKHLLRGE